MRIETIRATLGLQKNGKHFVAHDHRRFHDGQSAETWASAYDVNDEENGKVLIAALRQGLVFEAAYLTQLYHDRLFNFGGRDQLTAEDVTLFWGEGKGCHLMVFHEMRNQTANGEMETTDNAGSVSGYQLNDFNPADEGEHRDRNRMREILQELSSPLCPRDVPVIPLETVDNDDG